MKQLKQLYQESMFQYDGLTPLTKTKQRVKWAKMGQNIWSEAIKQSSFNSCAHSTFISGQKGSKHFTAPCALPALTPAFRPPSPHFWAWNPNSPLAWCLIDPSSPLHPCGHPFHRPWPTCTAPPHPSSLPESPVLFPTVCPTMTRTRSHPHSQSGRFSLMTSSEYN